MKRPPAGSIPDCPGSYQFKDKDGRVIYVGKAKSLRSRLSSYFGDPRLMHGRTAQMVQTAESVEWIEVRNEVEALMLEYSLIKQYRPRFNVRLIDDKSYPFLAITMADEWPRARVMRGKHKKDTKYFGPYAHAYAIRETLDLLLRTFPIRTCSDNKYTRHERLGRPCLLFHIEKCVGPCAKEVDKTEYDALVQKLIDFLDGETTPVIKQLEVDMRSAATEHDFERAARLRDRLTAVNKAVEKQQMVGGREEDYDVFGVAGDELEASVQVFYIRRGRVVGRKGFLVDKVEQLDDAAFAQQVIEQHYSDSPLSMPKEVFVPVLPDDLALMEEWLTLERREEATDGRVVGRVAIRVPQRGEKRSLQETVTKNASQELARHRLRRASDHNSRAQALRNLQESLGLPVAPLRIECFDMSHLSGTDYVGSMVVMEDGLAKKSDYRRFKVKTVGGNDDYAAMEEVLTRRFSALLRDRRIAAEERTAAAEAHRVGLTEELTLAALSDGSAEDDGDDDDTSLDEPTAEDRMNIEDTVEDERVGDSRKRAAAAGVKPKIKKFAYPPNLLLIDGGKGQLNVAVRVLEDLGLADEIPVASLAKQFEEVYLPGQADPVRLPRQSEALYLLQRLRDESHRFAISFHRELRDKRMTKSVLDDIPGLGPTRRKRLTSEMGGVRAVQAASLETLTALPWLPDAVAQAVFDKCHVPSAASARTSA